MSEDYSNDTTIDIINVAQARIGAIQAFCISVRELTAARIPDPRRWEAAYRVISAAELETGDLSADLDELARRWSAGERQERRAV
jgi:hypothetical protein